MQATILVSRRASALSSLIFSSKAIVEHLELDPALLAGFSPVGVRDQPVKDMMALEAAAKIMEQCALLSGSIKQEETVTTVTVNIPVGITPAGDLVISDALMIPEDLPAPTSFEEPQTDDVLTEEQPTKRSSRKSSRSK